MLGLSKCYFDPFEVIFEDPQIKLLDGRYLPINAGSGWGRFWLETAVTEILGMVSNLTQAITKTLGTLSFDIPSSRGLPITDVRVSAKLTAKLFDCDDVLLIDIKERLLKSELFPVYNSLIGGPSIPSGSTFIKTYMSDIQKALSEAMDDIVNKVDDYANRLENQFCK